MRQKTVASLPATRFASLIELKLNLLAPTYTFAAKSAWHLSQMYTIAHEYRSNVRKMLTSSQDSADTTFRSVIRIREVARTLRYHAEAFALSYEVMEAHMPEDTKDADFSSEYRAKHRFSKKNVSGALAALHQKHFKSLSEQLQRAGCSEMASVRFADDVIDLLWDLDSFIRKIKRLTNGQKDEIQNLVRLFKQIANAWSLPGSHTKYHLGGYQDQDNDFFNPGVLGWSLIILSEMERTEG